MDRTDQRDIPGHRRQWDLRSLQLWTFNCTQFTLDNFVVDNGVNPVPEPASLTMLGLGLVGVCVPPLASALAPDVPRAGAGSRSGFVLNHITCRPGGTQKGAQSHGAIDQTDRALSTPVIRKKLRAGHRGRHSCSTAAPMRRVTRDTVLPFSGVNRRRDVSSQQFPSKSTIQV